MDWESKYGAPRVLKVLQGLQKQGRRVPELEKRPRLRNALEILAWRMWADLDRRRTYAAFCPNPISTGECLAWLDLHAVTDTETRVACYDIVSAVDDFALEAWASKRPRKG